MLGEGEMKGATRPSGSQRLAEQGHQTRSTTGDLPEMQMLRSHPDPLSQKLCFNKASRRF